MRFEFASTDGETALLLCKPDVLVMMSGEDAFTFDLDGRLMYASFGGIHLRRGMDNRVVCLSGGEDAKALVEKAYAVARKLVSEAPPEAQEIFAPVVRCRPEDLEEDARRFREVYGTIPVLPPDQYLAVYLQATVGCAFNRCSFCTLYRGRPFHIRSVADFRRHAASVAEFLGPDAARRRTIFLGEANALSVLTQALGEMMEAARRVFPDRPFYSFADPTLHRSKSLEELRDLASRGLRRVTLGLETAYEPLYAGLGKPGSPADAASTARHVKASGLGLGLTVLSGLGDEETARRHLAATRDFLAGLDLGAEDIVYLSPLRGGEAPGEEELGFRTAALREAIEQACGGKGVKVVTYDVARFTYT